LCTDEDENVHRILDRNVIGVESSGAVSVGKGKTIPLEALRVLGS
jgi:hypothetical protein